MSKYRIIANDELKTVSVLFPNTRFFSAKYLLKRWQNERYFGQGILPFSNWQEFWNFAKELSNALIQVSGIFSITPNHLFDSALVEYPVFRKRVKELTIKQIEKLLGYKIKVKEIKKEEENEKQD